MQARQGDMYSPEAVAKSRQPAQRSMMRPGMISESVATPTPRDPYRNNLDQALDEYNYWKRRNSASKKASASRTPAPRPTSRGSYSFGGGR